MSGRGGRFVRGRGGRGRGRGIYGRGIGGNISTVTSQKKGLFATLGDNVFTYNEKVAVDQLAITLRQIVKHVGTKIWTRNQQQDTQLNSGYYSQTGL